MNIDAGNSKEKQPINNSNQSTLEGVPSFEELLEDPAEDEVVLPPLPSQIIVGDDFTEEQRRLYNEKKQRYLDSKLKQYSITPEEWQEVMAYKGSGYFIPSSVLRDIDLFELHMPSYGGAMERIRLLENPKELLDSYCKMYSAMCKFGKKNKRPTPIKRVDSGLFTNARVRSRETESFLSFTSNEDNDYEFRFVDDKGDSGADAVFLDGELDAGLPCISFPEMIEETTGEAEVLIPPFLSIEYENEEGRVENYYPLYRVKISKKDNTQVPILSPERTRQVLNSDIAYRYYLKWYNLRTNYTFNNYPDEEKEEYNILRDEFLTWQADFKNIMRIKFSSIEEQIYSSPDKKWGKLLLNFFKRAFG